MPTSTDPPPADAPVSATAAADEIGIAPAVTRADFVAVAHLQEQIWGPANTVPVPQLIAVAHTGGTVLLARGTGPDHRLLGFCYGFVGIDVPADGAPPGDTDHAETVLWSHMLAVRPDARGHGLGRRLKWAQADHARRLGLSRVLWTFDPLEARNAYLNLRVLGATARRYEVNRYGHMDDALNAGLDSDRLIADWRVDGSARPTPEVDPDPPVLNPDPPVLNRDAPAGAVRPPPASADMVRIAVPTGDWRAPAAHARRWRANARSAFTVAFAAGFVAVDLQPGPDVSHYVLVPR